MSVNHNGKNLDLRAAFKQASLRNGAPPLVMTCIGEDDPHRGDTHGVIGLGQAIANLIGGEFVYVDKNVVKNHFNDAADYNNNEIFNSRLEDYLARFRKPSFLLGRYARFVAKPFYDRAGIYETGFMGYNDCVNEAISMQNGEGKNALVAHDITPDLLAVEGAKFARHYRDIQKPLLGIFMGGPPDAQPGKFVKQDICPEIDAIIEKIALISCHYDALDCFIMPSRRTGASYYEDFKVNLAQRINDKLLGKTQIIRVIGQSYDDAISVYNPYRGLIAQADHLAVIGYSLSMVSELLSAGKNIYLSDTGLYGLEKLEEKGYIRNILSLDNAPFPTHQIPDCNITQKIAHNMILEYLRVKDMRDYNGKAVYTRYISGANI